uniref:Mp1p-like protein 7 n=5 Tax=Talaromyces marneffei TaxID=37727 RepID=B8K398_TALMA|nr:Mp1p-like protein 7 [Talaromyces marneffei]
MQMSKAYEMTMNHLLLVQKENYDLRAAHEKDKQKRQRSKKQISIEQGITREEAQALVQGQVEASHAVTTTPAAPVDPELPASQPVFLPSLIIFSLSALAPASSYIDHYITKNRPDPPSDPPHGYKSVIDVIAERMKTLNYHIDDYHGGPATFLLTGPREIIQAIKDGIQKFRRQVSLDEHDANLLVAYIEKTLKPPVQWVIEALIEKEKPLVARGFRSQVLQSLQNMKNPVEQLRDIISRKIIQSAQKQYFTKEFNNITIKVIQQGIDAFDNFIHCVIIPTMPPGGAIATNNSPAVPTFTGAA